MDAPALFPKHLKALALLKEDRLTYRQIAKAVGIKESTLKHWIAGDPNTGAAASIFSAEVRRLRQNKNALAMENFEEAQCFMLTALNTWLKRLRDDPLSTKNAKIMALACSVLSQGDRLSVAKSTSYRRIPEKVLTAEYWRLTSHIERSMAKSDESNSEGTKCLAKKSLKS